MKVLDIFEELITSRLPWSIRHTLFVLYRKPLVLRSVDSSLELNKQLWKKSRIRWVDSEPNDELTWGVEVSGDNFVHKVFSYDVFGSNKTILEIGPGTGRILKSLINLGMPYQKYFGIDISTKNTKYLRAKYSNAKHNFIDGDIETIELEGNFDIVLSSLTFKHLFPSFKKALSHVSKHMNPGAMIFFDLPEGKLKCFHRDAYVRWYSKSEVRDILGECKLEILAFDHIKHTSWHKRRLFVAARNLTRSQESLHLPEPRALKVC